MNFRMTAASLGATAMLFGAAAPAFAQTTADYPTDTSTTTTQTAKAHKGKKARKLTDAQLTTVATALGTDLATLKAAQAKVKAAVAATDAKESKGEQNALLASELGVTAAQVKAAFASVAGAGGTRAARGDCPAKPASGTTGTTGATADYPADA